METSEALATVRHTIRTLLAARADGTAFTDPQLLRYERLCDLEARLLTYAAAREEAPPDLLAQVQEMLGS